jgi:hypothetical protein
MSVGDVTRRRIRNRRRSELRKEHLTCDHLHLISNVLLIEIIDLGLVHGEFREAVAECAGLRRAAARTGEEISALAERFAGDASHGIAINDGAGRRDGAEVHESAGGGMERDPGDTRVREMPGGTAHRHRQIGGGGKSCCSGIRNSFAIVLHAIVSKP